MSLISIGKSGLLAAQAGLATTGHNITNANVPGYSRQAVLQRTAVMQQQGAGFIGTGTEVASVRRYYDDFLTKQLLGAQAHQSQVDNYLGQLVQIDNLLADSTAGLSPALQDFFKGVQDANSNPASVASRESMLSGANSLAGRMQSLSARLKEIGQGTNSEITYAVGEINSYADQIAKLNVQIAGLSGDPDNLPNDLLDQRDQLISNLNQLVKVNIQPGENNMLNLTIGTGQPLVVGGVPQQLAVGASPTDPERLVVGYPGAGGVSPLPDSTFTGGALGGLFQFRNSVLDQAQNRLGQIAAGLADAFNDQHRLGQDLDGNPGGDFFAPMTAAVGYDRRNAASSTLNVVATIKDGGQLTTSDYDLNFDGTNMVLTRASDGKQTVITENPQVIDGVEYNITGIPVPGDHAQVRPTAGAAEQFKVALTDASKIALASPVLATAPTTNTGKAKIESTLDASYLAPGNKLTAPLTLDYDAAGNTLNGLPADKEIVVTLPNGNKTTYPAGTTSIPFTDGAQISFGGITLKISGKPEDNDTFTVGPTTAGVGDSRNGQLLADLQSKLILNGGNATFQTAYAQMTNFVANRTSEALISSRAAETAVEQSYTLQQNVSGVNLDEEAANLIRYQQAYQAAGKVMQVASQLFDTILSIGA